MQHASYGSLVCHLAGIKLLGPYVSSLKTLAISHMKNNASHMKMNVEMKRMLSRTVPWDKLGMPIHQCYRLVNSNCKPCPIVTLAHNTNSQMPPNNSLLYFEQGGVMILNQGVHFREPGGIATTFQEILTNEFLSMTNENQWKVI